MIPTYIIHYPKLSNRKKYLDKKIPNAAWITQYEKDLLKQHHIDMYVPDTQAWIDKCDNMYPDVPPFQQLKLENISCSIGHIQTWRTISYKKHNTFHLILEDDAIFTNPNFEKEIDKITKMSPPSWDVIFIGGAFSHMVAPTRGIINVGDLRYYLKGHPASNTVCAYILNPQSAKILYENMKNFTLPIDFELNYVMKQTNMNVYHIDQYLVKEGSSLGVYKSSQEAR